MTEEEAKTKWCPFARVQTVLYDKTRGPEAIIGAGGGHNRTPSETREAIKAPLASFCVGSGCAVWRLEPDTRETVTVVIEPDGNFHEKNPIERSGHCGLAGTP